MEQEEKLHDEVETVLEFTYLCDSLSAVGRCDIAVTATSYGWTEYWECDELLYELYVTYCMSYCMNDVTATSCGWTEYWECGELLYELCVSYCMSYCMDDVTLL